MNSPEKLLHKAYSQAIKQVAKETKISNNLPVEILNPLNTILEKAEQAKAVLTVTLTNVVYKLLHPEQDIRSHQSSIEEGYSGRTFDTRFITPFMKKQRFPHMAESGWLTRSLEQKVSYDEKYTGAIRPESLKSAFLNTIAVINKAQMNEEILRYLLEELIIQRDKQEVPLTKPIGLPIESIVDLLHKAL